MIKRDLEKELKNMAAYFPVVALLGPRQSGKTTLAKTHFKKYKYISFDDLDNRAFAKNDPRALLDSFKNEEGVILDEIQESPDFLSYIKTYVDEKKQKGFFILTGSQNFLLNQTITQTLSGRVAILTLLPFSIRELKTAQLLFNDAESQIVTGFYPRVYDEKIPFDKWYPSYVKTYVERDVRQITNILDLSLFQTFMKLCAGRIGQILNLTSLSDDCGVAVNTIKGWISILGASYIMFTLNAHHKNFSKRLIKSPKLYFYDTGLACHLLGIKSPNDLHTHYLRGGLFENLVIADLFKQQYNLGQEPNIYFWRDKTGHEVDCIIEQGQNLLSLEVKATKTISQDVFSGLNYWNELAQTKASDKTSFLIYGGNENQTRSAASVLGWKSLDRVLKPKT